MLSPLLILDSVVRRKQLRELGESSGGTTLFSSISFLPIMHTPNLPCRKLAFIKGKINPLLKEGWDGEGKREQALSGVAFKLLQNSYKRRQ